MFEKNFDDNYQNEKRIGNPCAEIPSGTAKDLCVKCRTGNANNAQDAECVSMENSIADPEADFKSCLEANNSPQQCKDNYVKAETIRTGGAVESQKIDDLYAKLDTEVQEEEATKSLTAATETCAAESTKLKEELFSREARGQATSTGKQGRIGGLLKGLAATKFADEMYIRAWLKNRCFNKNRV